jgi:hypothetical protein
LIVLDPIDLLFNPYVVSLAAFALAIGNITYTALRDRSKIRITFQEVSVVGRRSPDQVGAICVNMVNIRGRPTTVFFPDVILPDKRSGGNILFAMSKYADPRKRGATPSVRARARSDWPNRVKADGQGGTPIAFPYELAVGKLTEVWIENTDLADELKQLGYKSGDVKLKISVPNASRRPYVSKKIIFDVDSAKMRG